MHGMFNGTFFFGPRPLGRRQKVEYLLISITMSVSKILKPKFGFLFKTERYLTCQTGFSFGRLGHAPKVGLGGTGGWGVKNFNFWKFNQIWCVSYSQTH